ERDLEPRAGRCRRARGRGSAGLSIFELARYMGTSVDMIDRTYGHLARGSEDLARAKLDAHAASDVGRLGQDWATL
ncbi:MAG: hypothetical protein MSC30_19205, partial [Gaiellaceae bacterium MAG52_C11]|nr:hypothetical protein [Candidatus Gaiellasilicea maunaloa]